MGGFDSYKRILNNISLHKKIAAVLSISLFVVSFVFLIGFRYIIGIHNRVLYNAIAGSLSYSAQGIQSALQSVEDTSFQIFCDTQIQQGLDAMRCLTSMSDENQEFQSSLHRKDIYNTLTNYLSSRDYISNIIIVTDGKEVTVSDYSTTLNLDEAMYESMVQQAGQLKGQSVWVVEDSGGLFLIRTIRKINRFPLEDLGTLIVQVDVEKLITSASKFSSTLEQSSILLSSQGKLVCSTGDLSFDSYQGEIHYDTDYEIIGSDRQKYFCVNRVIEQTPLAVTCLLSYNQIFFPMIRTYILTFFVIAIVLIGVCMISNQLILNMMSHFQVLIQKMDRFSGKTEGDSIPVYDYSQRGDEVGLIHRHFDEMVSKIECLIQENYVKQLYIKEAQLKALKTQIHPHFLYNTLNIINWRAKLIGDTQISVITEALSNLLRAMLQDDADCHTIEKELSLVQDYITIQQYRFGSRLCYHQNKEGELDQVLIPRLIIQPLIENAIKYAVEVNMYETNIYVEIFSKQNEIHIYVKNDGSQFGDEPIEKRSDSFGIGLSNINSRLKLMFGDSYGLSCYNEEELAVVLIRIPVMPEHKEK